MPTAKLAYENSHARAWLRDDRAPEWEVLRAHPYSGEMAWEATTCQINVLSRLTPKSPLGAFRADQPEGSREIWVLDYPTHLRDANLVVERFVRRDPGGLFWHWRFYTRVNNPLPDAAFQYENYPADDDRTHAWAALHVLTHAPTMTIKPDVDPGA